MINTNNEIFMQQINESTKDSFKDVFKSYSALEGGNVYVNIKKIFYAYYEVIPNMKNIDRISCKKMLRAIKTEKSEQILKIHYRQVYDRSIGKMIYIDLIYFMKDGIVINLDDEEVCIAFAPENEAKAQTWIDWSKTFTLRKKSTINEICLVTQSTEGLRTTAIKIKKPKLNLTQNYNDDIVETHKSMVKKLREKDANGLFLFHGLPGTGKSTYIKFLIHHLNKKVIFMSPKLAGNLDAPELMSFLIRNSDSVIVIEDAEELITARDGGRNSSISTLLNLTDGLLGECLSIQVIATFNTQIANIDKALLRKGRLQTLYHFSELSIAKSNALLQEIGVTNYYTNKAMTLAEIYNTKEEAYQFKNERVAIGFIQPAKVG